MEVAVGCVVDVVPGGVFPERGADVGAVVGAEVLVVGKRGVVLTGGFFRSRRGRLRSGRPASSLPTAPGNQL